jgi:cell division protease FtsH
LANLVNEAAVAAVRGGRVTLTAADFASARDRVLLGTQRSSLLAPGELATVAVHEAGHALVATLSPYADPVSRVTVLGAGQALGLTETLPADDRRLYGERYLADTLAVRLGGRGHESELPVSTNELVVSRSQHKKELTVRHPRIIIASISLAAAAAIGGGVTAAAVTNPPASRSPAASQHGTATVRTAQAAVGGKTETILVNSQGLPLYFFANDTAAKSVVTGELAALWPPLTSPSPAATGLTGKLAAVSDVHGDQVAYNGHLLYDFADDHAGQVTGQGVQGFFVATPGLAPIAGSSASTGTVPAASPGNGYGY